MPKFNRSANRTIRVLIVEDSCFMQRRLTEIIESDPGFSVVGVASNGLEGLSMSEDLEPDVITMDINMPKMDGLCSIDHIMASEPRPIIVVSSYARHVGRAAMYALELGVIDIIEKPSARSVSLDLPEKSAEIIKKIQMASRIKVVRNAGRMVSLVTRLGTRQPGKEFQITSLSSLPRVSGKVRTPELIAIGSSTGGPSVLAELLNGVKSIDFPPVLVAQHLPGKFTRDLAEQLNYVSMLEVIEAQAGMIPQRGCVYVAPGDQHMKLGSTGRLELASTPAINYCRPSVDVLFASIADAGVPNVMGLILTGMGKDGAEGARKLKETGAQVWGQDEGSCVVFGMPEAAHSAGGLNGFLTFEELVAVFKFISGDVNHPEGSLKVI
ncbi:MAG: chemotaxis-specific protein-glutamate methyltransferase CheB [Verrucomicrobiota bacterium]